ncbi:hypothetical protein RZO68_00005, partial [Citrobacter freundii]|nr:hypothetical protein [Citrobacter freundii]MDV0488596.1 hypothetical protein [Citrobacter freundii]MDV0491872.1 hypothetical protein [Citrobacter freundii]MDV0496868.1 hypothetical protein [Citrobacter freundii]MDV0501418.1 hypothetical protein [Citrobacter freundii]
GVIFFCISDTLVPTTYLVDTTLSYAADYDQTALAGRLPLNVGDTIIIAGLNARPGTFEGIFLDNSQIMTGMISKKKRQMLAVNGGVYDREICHK